MQQAFRIGDPLSDPSAMPDDDLLRDWVGSAAFRHWVVLRDWLDASYPGVFRPDWIHNAGGWRLRYNRSRPFCTFLPGYRSFAIMTVLDEHERFRFEARRDRLSPELCRLHDAATTHPEGKWLKIAISSVDDRLDVIDLLALKRPPGRCPSRGGGASPLSRSGANLSMLQGISGQQA
ncbi:DUF3788 domain-containing protein [Cereibacter sphaeroides]|uniref:DUF3788 domain-containing protein n=1 Tax=Cereibacter sphaeroides TaxID=1063 RepID=UPI001F2F9E1E|nr:DUF3788 domain-containing protein [Cereibacter sphaeroides]MCE6967092.1 DUF3788 domain-containing protein [Cereibacter sphaeroides]